MKNNLYNHLYESTQKYLNRPFHQSNTRMVFQCLGTEVMDILSKHGCEEQVAIKWELYRIDNQYAAISSLSFHPYRKDKAMAKNKSGQGQGVVYHCTDRSAIEKVTAPIRKMLRETMKGDAPAFL